MPDRAYISKIVLPSGATTYYLKDEEARQMIAGGVTFIVAWDGTSTPVVANIPSGVTVYYGTPPVAYTGTLSPETDDAYAEPPHAQAGAFYLVKSSTEAGVKDSYAEYVPVGSDGSKDWEKIGDTQIDLSDVVTGINTTTDTVLGEDTTFNTSTPSITLTGNSTASGGVKYVESVDSISASGDNVTALTGLGSPSTAKVIGSSSTFNITQPSVSLTLSDTGTTNKVLTDVSINKTSDSVTALTGLGTPTTDTFLKTVSVSTQPAVTLSTGSTGDVTIVTGHSAPTTKYLSASASGTAVSHDSADVVTALTGLGTPSTTSAASSVTPTTSNLVLGNVIGVQSSTTSVTGVQSTTTIASKATVASSTSNTDYLKGISVANETLTFGAYSVSFADVTVPIKNASATTVPIKNASASTFATGSVSDSGTGSGVVTDVSVGDTVTVVTGYASPTTDEVLGTGTGHTITQPTITLTANSSTGTGRIKYVESHGSPTTTKLKATVSTNVALSTTDGDAITAITPTTDNVLGEDTTLSKTEKYISGSASGGNVAWKSKDEKTVVTGYSSTTTDTVLGTGSTLTPSVTSKYMHGSSGSITTTANKDDVVTVVTSVTPVKGKQS